MRVVLDTNVFVSTLGRVPRDKEESLWYGEAGER